ncbi:hypothetical protein M0812_26731 [Anaeramoeba flamelloides]|uniref:PAS fold domain-containing protein n=1 Tax=Anaeramoeba flamelloides TaxID=1746091 RepID=A0AAV7YEZ0_9EUKA|nr:hypothetical protein M0812_26731 [Anaeramoeba flamelloides]
MGNAFFQNCKKKRLKPNIFQNYLQKIHLSSDPICLLKTDGLFDHMNKAFLSLLKINNEPIISGKSVYTLFPQTQPISKNTSAQEIQKILHDFRKSKNVTKTFFWAFLNTEGQNIYVRIWMNLIQDSTHLYIQLVLGSAKLGSPINNPKRVKIARHKQDRDKQITQRKEQFKPKLELKHQQGVKNENSKHFVKNLQGKEETKTRKINTMEEIHKNNYNSQRIATSEMFPSRLHCLNGSQPFLAKFGTQKISKPQKKQTEIQNKKFLVFPISLTNISNSQKTVRNTDQKKQEKKEKQEKQEKQQKVKEKQQQPFDPKKIYIEKIKPFTENEEKHRILSEQIYEIKSLLSKVENFDIKFDVFNALNDISDLFDQSFSKIAWTIQYLLLQHKLSSKDQENSNHNLCVNQKDEQLRNIKKLEGKKQQEILYSKKMFSYEDQSNQILIL